MLSATAQPTPPVRVRLCFAASGTAVGLISNGISYFLLLYYSQVIGMDAGLAGLAMMIALIVDAATDPIVGRWSDGLKHRWGRRHPFLFASMLPVPLFYYLLWDPPQLGDAGLFFYLVGVTVLLRIFLTAHVVPFTALLPEFTRDYEHRTRLMNDSYAAAWFFGTVMAVMMYAWWLADTIDYPDGAGILRAEGYVEAGWAAALVITFCLVGATLGTRKYIASLSVPKRPAGPAARDLFDIVSERSTAAMLLSGLFGAAASGTATSLWAYMQPYFWGFDSAQTSTLLAAQLISAVLAFILLPRLMRGREKKSLLIAVSIASLLVTAGPVLLSLAEAFPAKGTDVLFPLMAILGVIQVMLIVMSGAITASMIADLVEHRARESGNRQEGMLFAIQSFITKVAGGVGVWVGGLLLTWIEFPAGEAAADVLEDVSTNLGWAYAPSIVLFYILSIAALTYYQISRHTHLKNIADLEASS